MRNSHRVAVPLCLALASACARERPLAVAGPMAVVGGWGYPSTSGLAGAYLVLANSGDAADTLMEVSGEEIGDASVHGVRTEGVRSTMFPIDALEVPPHGRVGMRPGGIHMMLEGLTREVSAGDSIRLTARFARAGSVEVVLPVIPYGEIPE